MDQKSILPSSDDIAELDRQWAKIEAGEPTVPHEKVARWLETGKRNSRASASTSSKAQPSASNSSRVQLVA